MCTCASIASSFPDLSPVLFAGSVAGFVAGFFARSVHPLQIRLLNCSFVIRMWTRRQIVRLIRDLWIALGCAGCLWTRLAASYQPKLLPVRRF
jgi:hypothetical protein